MTDDKSSIDVPTTDNSNSQIQYFKSLSDSKIVECLELWQESCKDLTVMAYVAEKDEKKVPKLQKTFNSLSVPLIGAIFPALVDDAEFKSSGVLLICLPNKPLWHLTADLPQDKDELSKCIEDLAKHLESGLNESEDTALFMIFDAMVPNIATILDDLYMHLGDSVHYMGVNAGSETFQPMACLFDNKKIIQNGLLTLLLSPHSGAVMEHGYKAPKETIIATTTTGNCITNIDWKPAFEVYSEKVKKQFGVDITAENFYEYGVHFPFGIIRADGEVLVRIPVMLGEDNSLYCVGEIPENSILTLLDAPEPKSLHTVESLSKKLSNNSNNLLFYCAGRRLHLKDSACNELTEITELITDNRTYGGALSLGEIGSSHKGGYPLFHNATLIAIPIGETKKQ